MSPHGVYPGRVVALGSSHVSQRCSQRHASLDNYRPISLTDVFYKLYAALLQKRLAFYIDPRVRDTQLGFRRGKSTSQPIHILRRLIETHERQQSPLHILLVDWARAFDSVSFAAIERSLVRLGVPSPFVRAVMAIYNHPQLRVNDSGSTSEETVHYPLTYFISF